MAGFAGRYGALLTGPDARAEAAVVFLSCSQEDGASSAAVVQGVMTVNATISRRHFLAFTGAIPLAFAGACAPTEPGAAGAARLRLHARSRTRDVLTGNDVLYGDGLRRAYIRVPPTYQAGTPAPLIIALHGAGGRGDTFQASFASRTDALGAIVLAPDSLYQTWDVIEDEFGPDVGFINSVLDQTFDRCNVDASRIAVMGFSDGATYAISLGIANGDQLAGVIAYSPGFYVVDHPLGTPAYFISHGISDAVLPIQQTSRKIVPELEGRGSTVTYVEFDGGHAITPAIADQAMSWVDGRFDAAAIRPGRPEHAR
jgi:predicted esterase